MIAFSLVLDRPWGFAAACTLLLLTVALVWRRKPAIAKPTTIMGSVSLLVLALGAGELTWLRPSQNQVIVMVDLSGSTRGASFRDPGKLEQRIHQLLGETPYRTIYFSDHITDSITGLPLPDLPGDKTLFTPPAATAILLFSDARFEPPAHAPPTFIVGDPMLDRTGDASVHRLEIRKDALAATTHIDARPRRLTIDAASTQPTILLEVGRQTTVRPLRNDARIATATVTSDDRWPENDALSILLSPPLRMARWFISNGSAPSDQWLIRRPGDLEPRNSPSYLSPAVIALDNLAASQLSTAQLSALEQYVRDLGGALIIGGGDRAFAPGQYEGTPLESISPLATSPPLPAIHWILLADSSGSMSAAAGQLTRWQLASSALARLLPALPPADPVSVGSFAKDLTWWSTGKPAQATASLPLPPPSIVPNGPTNLESALNRVAQEAGGAMAAELLVVSDADVNIDQPARLIEQLKSKKIRLHILAIGEGRGLETLRDIATRTGGSLREQLNPAKWAGETRQLLAAASPGRLLTTPIQPHFLDRLSSLPPRNFAPWNRTWLKKDSTALAEGTHDNESVPLAARWNVGSGEVVSCAFAPDAREWESLAALVARPARDPRFAVTWNAAQQLRVSIDAQQDGGPLNDLYFTLEVTAEDDPEPRMINIPQSAPGHYDLSLPAPRRRGFAAVRMGNQIIDRIAVAARYAPEFDVIGNDHDAMRLLASRTGGAVVDSSITSPLDLRFPRRALTLGPWLGLIGSVLLLAALCWWRIG